MAKNAVKKKVGRPPVDPGEPGPKRAKILAALTLYFSTGSYGAVTRELQVPTTTLHAWIHKYPELCEEAKKGAAARTEIRLTRIIDLSLDRQIENLESKKDITPETLNRIMGTAIDKLWLVQGKSTSTGKMELSGKIQFTFGDANLKPYVPDTKNRMAKYN